MKKRLLALFIVLAMLGAVLVGCGPKKVEEKVDDAAAKIDDAVEDVVEKVEDAATTAVDAVDPAAAEGFTVILVTMDLQDQHWMNVDAGAKKAVEELGNVTYKWFAPDVKDDAKQIESINNAVAAGTDVLLVAANGPDSISSALEEAANSGVKIIYVDSPANFQALQTLSTDNEAAGKTAGETLLAKLEADGITSGKIGIIGVNSATASTNAREDGFRAAFEGKGFELLETQYGEGDISKSNDIANNYISQGVVGLFGTNEGSTVGVGNSIAEDGDKIAGVGFDKSDAILQLIKDGHLLAAMSQNPDQMGYLGVMSAAKAMAGEVLEPAVMDTGVSIITADTID